MTKAKSIKSVIMHVCAFLAVIVTIFFVFSIPWFLIYANIWFSPNPPAPEVTYGEFPFEIVCEIEGKTHTIRDVFVCEYDGIDMNEGTGKYRSWKCYIKSTGEEDLILLEDGNLKLACALGNAQYYMSDPFEASEEYVPFIYYIKTHDDIDATSMGVMNIESLLEQYKIELISWKLSEPIKNSFE